MSVGFYKIRRHGADEELLLDIHICNEEFRRDVWEMICNDHDWLYAKIAPDMVDILAMKYPHRDRLSEELQSLQEVLRSGVDDSYAMKVADRLQQFINEAKSITDPDIELGFF